MMLYERQSGWNVKWLASSGQDYGWQPNDELWTVLLEEIEKIDRQP